MVLTKKNIIEKYFYYYTICSGWIIMTENDDTSLLPQSLFLNNLKVLLSLTVCHSFRHEWSMKLQFLLVLQKLALFAYMMYSCKHLIIYSTKKERIIWQGLQIKLHLFAHFYWTKKIILKKETFNTFFKILMNETA